MANLSPLVPLDREILRCLRDPNRYHEQRVDQFLGALTERGWLGLSMQYVAAACARLAALGVITHERADCYAMTSVQLAAAA